MPEHAMRMAACLSVFFLFPCSESIRMNSLILPRTRSHMLWGSFTDGCIGASMKLRGGGYSESEEDMEGVEETPDEALHSAARFGELVSGSSRI